MSSHVDSYEEYVHDHCPPPLLYISALHLPCWSPKQHLDVDVLSRLHLASVSVARKKRPEQRNVPCSHRCRVDDIVSSSSSTDIVLLHDDSRICGICIPVPKVVTVGMTLRGHHFGVGIVSTACRHQPEDFSPDGTNVRRNIWS